MQINRQQNLGFGALYLGKSTVLKQMIKIAALNGEPAAVTNFLGGKLVGAGAEDVALVRKLANATTQAIVAESTLRGVKYPGNKFLEKRHTSALTDQLRVKIDILERLDTLA